MHRYLFCPSRACQEARKAVAVSNDAKLAKATWLKPWKHHVKNPKVQTLGASAVECCWQDVPQKLTRKSVNQTTKSRVHASGVAIKKIAQYVLTLTTNINIHMHNNVTCTVQRMHACRTCQDTRSSRSEERQLQAKELTIYFMKTTNVSIVLWELSLNRYTLRLKKNPSLSLLFIESLSGTVEGGDGKQITL